MWHELCAVFTKVNKSMSSGKPYINVCVILVRALSEMVSAKVLCLQQILILVISLGSIHSYLGTNYMWNFISINFYNCKSKSH